MMQEILIFYQFKSGLLLQIGKLNLEPKGVFNIFLNFYAGDLYLPKFNAPLAACNRIFQLSFHGKAFINTID